MINYFQDFFSSGENLAFLVLSLFAIGGAILMVSFTRVIHMVLSLAFTFLSLAGLYIILEAEFVALVQVLIYAGAIAILMIFGIMMTRHGDEEDRTKSFLHQAFLLIGSLGLFGVLFFAIREANFTSPATDLSTDNTLEIGKLIYNQYVIPFELLSVLLTVSFIGAIVLAKKGEN